MVARITPESLNSSSFCRIPASFWHAKHLYLTNRKAAVRRAFSPPAWSAQAPMPPGRRGAAGRTLVQNRCPTLPRSKPLPCRDSLIGSRHDESR